jgi:exopolysaccharide production protein ExoZ
LQKSQAKDPPKKPLKKHLESLQIFRGLAALAVALHHARLGTSEFVQTIPAPLEALLAQGFLGVDFFFVLSGFIILHTHYDDPRSAPAAAAYALKRVTRIYLPYLPITALVIAAYLMFPALSQSDRTWGWFTSLTLLPSIYEPALPVAWTLVHEMLFYLLFLVFFVSRRIFAAMIAAWSCVLLKQTFQLQSFNLAFLNVLFHPINFEFVFGLFCAFAYRHITPRQGLAAGVAGVAVFALYFLWFTASARVLFGLGSALLVLGISLNDSALRSKILARLGDSSYALYLIHNPLISLTSRLAARVAVLDHWFSSLLFSVGCAVSAGYAYHRLFERPLLRKVRLVLPKPGKDAALASG